jgi:hypothetical protein
MDAMQFAVIVGFLFCFAVIIFAIIDWIEIHKKKRMSNESICLHDRMVSSAMCNRWCYWYC